MNERIDVTFRVRDKGGALGGTTVSGTVPKFELDQFMKTANAMVFVEKQYYAATKKIMREIEEQKNGTVPSDLDSFEAVIARSLTFTREEIKDWIATRDWTKAQVVIDKADLLERYKMKLPSLSSRSNPFSQKLSEQIANQMIAPVADKLDAVADFLFTVLTVPRSPVTVDL